MEQGQLRLYKAEAKNLECLVALMNADAAHPSYDTEFVRWKYYENPAGEGRLYFAEDEHRGMICGAYNVIAWDMLIGGRHVKCAQSVDTMVHPRCRGEGVFQKLFRFAADQLASENVPFIIGFPNHTAFSKFMKLGWRNPTHLRTFALVLDVRKFLEKNGGMTRRMAIRAGNCLLDYRNGRHCFRNGNKNLNISSVRSFDELPSGIHQSADVQTWRDAGFLEWRYVKRPKNTYEILKVSANGTSPLYFVLNRTGYSAEILDIVPCRDERQVETGLSALCRHLKEEGVYTVRCASSGRLSQALQRVGFLARSEKAPLIVYPLAAETGIEKLAGYEWLLRAGDIEAT